MPDTENIPRITISPRPEAQKTLPISRGDHGSFRPHRVTLRGEGQREPVAKRYPIIEKIGDGGMGVVYLAKDVQLSRFVAIKRLNQSSLASEAMKTRFFREAKAIAALNHSHIVHIYELGEDNEGPYIVMEYVPGPKESSPDKEPPSPFTLADKVHRDGPMRIEPAIALLLKLANAVQYAHGCHIIHRDLKPSNVLLDGSDNPKIVDFGLARTMDDSQNKLTVPGEKMLSLGYGAPEQENDASDTDERADVYGLGALLYFSLTGQNPRYYREKDVPAELRPVLEKALETDRQTRWGSVAEFSEALMLVKAPTSIELPTTKTTWRCKWCDTVNPVGIHFCASCGWDGGETCRECGAETRYGIQYCGSCGADARAYETAILLRDRLARRLVDRDFAYVIQNAAQITGFRPVGPNGQLIVKDINEYLDRTKAMLQRREQLQSEIQTEIEHQNYERAQRHIYEYRNIGDEGGYARELEQIPSLIRKRDLTRVRQALTEGDLEHADMICAAIPADGDEDSEFLKLKRRIRQKRGIKRRRNALLTFIAVFLVYMFSAAPVYKLLGTPGDDEAMFFYRPASWICQRTPLGDLVRAWSRLWGVHRLFAPTPAQTGSSGALSEALPQDFASVKRLSELSTDYQTELTTLRAQHENDMNAWGNDYLDQLDRLRSRMQRAGDLEGWLQVTEVMDAFPGNHIELADDEGLPRDLHKTQDRFIKEGEKKEQTYDEAVLQTTSAYVNELKALQRNLTRDGAIEMAIKVNTAIKEAEASDPVTKARTRQAERKAAQAAESQ